MATIAFLCHRVIQAKASSYSYLYKYTKHLPSLRCRLLCHVYSPRIRPPAHDIRSLLDNGRYSPVRKKDGEAGLERAVGERRKSTSYPYHGFALEARGGATSFVTRHSYELHWSFSSYSKHCFPPLEKQTKMMILRYSYGKPPFSYLPGLCFLAVFTRGLAQEILTFAAFSSMFSPSKEYSNGHGEAVSHLRHHTSFPPLDPTSPLFWKASKA